MLWVSQPLIAFAPKTITPEPLQIAMIQGNTLLPKNIPVLVETFCTTPNYATGEQLKEGYKNNRLISCMIPLESGWNIEAIGDKGNARGVAQFWFPTFDRYSALYKIELDYHNPVDQLYLMNLMLRDGYGFEWTAYASCK